MTPIRGDGQIAYRLGGDRELDDEQIEYRLGQQNDARQVFWIGDGATADALGVSAGQVVTGADVGRVYALMDGANPETGEVLVKPKVAIAESSKLGAVPAYDAIVWAAAERGRDPESLFTTQRDRKDWAAFARQVQAKGDTYRVGVERIEALSAGAGVAVAGAYGKAEWANAVASKGQRVSVGVKGYDVGLTLSKGASIGLVMAPAPVREQLAKIVRQCALETYQELGERVAYGAKGHHGGGQVAERIAGTGFVGTATMEVTSRAGDPHVHFHAMIANLTMCVDGKARTIGAGGRDVLAHGAWASERFRMKYRAATAAAGLAEWGWNEATKEYDQLNISADARSVGSKRHNQIVAEKEIFGPDAGKQIDAMAERITRSNKSDTVETLAQVATRFGNELTTLKVELGGDAGLVVDDPKLWSLEEWTAYLDAALTEHNAVFTRVQAEKEIQRRMPAIKNPPAAVEKVADAYLGTSEVLDATKTVMSERLTGGQRYTTQAMLDGEKSVYETTAAGVGNGFHTLSPAAAEMALDTYEAAEGFTLNQGQRSMFMRWTIGGNQVDLTIGAAGTGKTAAAEAARYAYEAAGCRVLGISTSGLAAQNLGAAAGIDVTTAFGLARAITQGRAPEVDVVVWDEMGMASTREQAIILPWAAANGVDVRGMGDPKQLDSVGAGSTFGRQCDQLGAVELSENMRQAHDHERAAVTELRTGEVGLAFGIYADAGQITVSKTPEDRIAVMAANWARDAANVTDPHERLRESVMLSQTNATVAQLHDAARAHARARGWITGPDVEYRGPTGSRSWACGDALLIRKTLYRSRRDPQPEIFNGQRVIVTGIDPSSREMTVEWKTAGGDLHQRTLSADYVAGNTAPGVALTNHGAQGQSIRHVHADPDGADRNAAYVQTTRSVQRLDLYTDLNTLGISGTERINVLRMNDTDRARWAGEQLAARVDDRGWQHGETAHDATNTAVPMPEEEPSTTFDSLLARMRASREEADRERERRQLARTPTDERPYWDRTDAELATKITKLENVIELGERLPAQQGALDDVRKKTEVYQQRHTQLHQVVTAAQNAAVTIKKDVAAWTAEATDLVTQAKKPFLDAQKRVWEMEHKRFGKKAAARDLENARAQLQNTFPTAGDPDRYDWNKKATADTIQRLHGHDIQRRITHYAAADKAVTTALDKDKTTITGTLLPKVRPTASYELPVGRWQDAARDARGYKIDIEPAEKRWATPTPGGLIRAAESCAAELQARHTNIGAALNQLQARITDTQRRLDDIPRRVTNATTNLTNCHHEAAIRAAQTPTQRENEHHTSTHLRQRQEEAQAKKAARYTHFDGAPSHDIHHGPSHGGGMSL